MLKLGMLFAQDGRWHGRQVISSSWARTSLAEHSHVDNEGYGYFWWRHMFHVKTAGGTQQVVLAAAQGNGGQKIYIPPQYHLVAVFTGIGYNANWTPPNILMETIILPKLIETRPHSQPDGHVAKMTRAIRQAPVEFPAVSVAQVAESPISREDDLGRSAPDDCRGQTAELKEQSLGDRSPCIG